MKVVLGLLFAVLISASGPASAEHSPAFFDTGNTYTEQCIHGTDTFMHMACDAFVYGISQGMGLAFAIDSAPMFCLPDNSTPRQSIDVLNAYITKNPATNNYALDVLALKAWTDAWPSYGAPCHAATTRLR